MNSVKHPHFTAKNHSFLRIEKGIWNKRIYAMLVNCINFDTPYGPAGVEAAKAYLRKYHSQNERYAPAPVVPDGKQRRTDILLARLRGTDNEFTKLHAILCMSHGLDLEDSLLAGAVFDGVRIAERLDEMNREVAARVAEANSQFVSR